MTDPTAARYAVLAQVVDSVPDRFLTPLAQAVATMRGDKARALENLLVGAQRDRERRALVMAPLLPLFSGRTDGLTLMRFPSIVLKRLWKIAFAQEIHLAHVLDQHELPDELQIRHASNRICVAAAAVVRNDAYLIWPAGLTAPDERERGLVELAGCCDLAALVRQTLPSLKTWVGRPDADQLAALRVVMRDSADIGGDDGPRRFLDILSGHIGDAPLIVRLIKHSGAAREAALFKSELGVLIDRLLAAIDHRIDRINGFRLDDPTLSIKAWRDDLTWAADMLHALDDALPPATPGALSDRVRAARSLISKKLASLFGSVERAVDQVLPTIRVQSAGRMKRMVPDLETPPGKSDLATASAALAVLAATRSRAAAFGCEARRGQLEVALRERLATYADQALEAINAGDVDDEDVALKIVVMVADLLTALDAQDEARIVRRRVAVAGVPPATVQASPDAA